MIIGVLLNNTHFERKDMSKIGPNMFLLWSKREILEEVIGITFSLVLWSAVGYCAYCFLSSTPTEENPKTEISSVEKKEAEISSLNQEVNFLREENEELKNKLTMETRTLQQAREEWRYMYFRLDEELVRCKATK